MQSKTTSIFRLFSLFSKIQKGYQVIIVGNQRYEIKRTRNFFHNVQNKRRHISEREKVVDWDYSLTILVWWRCDLFTRISTRLTRTSTLSIGKIVDFIGCKWNGLYLASLADRAQKCVAILWRIQLKYRSAPEAHISYHEVKFSTISLGSRKCCLFTIGHGAVSAWCQLKMD